MKIYRYPQEKDWSLIAGRTRAGAPEQVKSTVSAIVSGVRAGGDREVLRYVRELDGFAADSVTVLMVPQAEIEASESLLPESLKSAIRTAASNIRKFHEAQKTEEIVVETMPGVICRQRSVPVRDVGLYVPGGTAPLFSTVLMLAVPARIAGCGRVILCTPAGKDGRVSPAILYSAKICGVTEIYRIGGAVAIAAMAYGTETLRRVDKIFGPGNAYVTEAKQQVSQDCAIDMPAGPSEVMIIADSSARPEFVGADFLSQLEHGRDSQAILLTTSPELAGEVERQVELQVQTLPRKDIIADSMQKSMAVVLGSEEEMVKFSNMYAPEHLIIATSCSLATAEGICNAGSVFLGNYSTESAGDYASGTNHTLPTGGWAVSCSGVNLSTFMKKITLQEITPDGLRRLGPVIESMALAEGLDAHANAVKIRMKQL